LVAALFDMARLSVEIVLVLVGTMTLWLGFLAVAEKAGLIRLLARVLDPLFRRLMPGVPSGHPALGHISMNFAANILGLDNAATPIGIKAMHSLQELNPQKDTATNAQILFLVLNSSSLTLLPVTIFMYRAQRPPGPGPHQHELRRRYPRPGQCRHAHSDQGDALAAGTQSAEGHRHQRPDPVPGAQPLVADTAAGDHLHVPRPAGRRRSDP